MQKFRDGVGGKYLLTLESGDTRVMNTGSDLEWMQHRAKHLANQFPNVAVTLYHAVDVTIASSPVAETKPFT